MSLPLVGIPDQIYTSHLFYNPDHEHFHNDNFLSTMKSGLFRLKMYALNKKNYGGTISLNNFITQKQSNSQSKLKEVIETAGKQHPESLFYNQKYDLAILNENSFESKGFLSYSEANKQRTHRNIMGDLISHAFKGVKKTGHIFLVINKKNIGGWSRIFYNRYKHQNVDSDWDYSISHIVSLKNTSWIIIKKHQEEQKIKVFDAKSFVKEVVKTNPTNNSLITDVTAILDHKKLIKEFNNEHSAYTKSVETDNLIKSGFNFNEKRWFMRVYRGKPFLLSQLITRVKSLKM